MVAGQDRARSRGKGSSRIIVCLCICSWLKNSYTTDVISSALTDEKWTSPQWVAWEG